MTPAPVEEVELKCWVPPGRRAAVAAAMATSTARRLRLQDAYLDTPELHLARAGLAWRLRREGSQWLQALKAAQGGGLVRFEHEVPLSAPTPDARLHGGTAPGRSLQACLAQAAAAGQAPGVRLQTDIRRVVRRVRAPGAVVDVAFDEGRLQADGAVQRLCELEFELVSGSPQALVALAARWRQRFGLVLDPRHKAERGFGLLLGRPPGPVRKAVPPVYARKALAHQAWAAVLDECLDQISRNALGLAWGDAPLRAAQVHQLRVGIRRLRSALRVFDGWVPAPPEGLVEGLRRLFAALGQTRDRDVLDHGVAAELQQAGGPALPPLGGPAPADPAALAGAPHTQQLLMDWAAWRAGLPAQDAPEAPPLARQARRRLRRWHERLIAEARAFDTLDDEALHALRKRVKRQRYGLEFLAPLWPASALDRHLQALTDAQQALGRLQDLAVAAALYRAQAEQLPQAWFAVGWLTARRAEAHASAREVLARLAALPPPGR